MVQMVLNVFQSLTNFWPSVSGPIGIPFFAPYLRGGRSPLAVPFFVSDLHLGWMSACCWPSKTNWHPYYITSISHPFDTCYNMLYPSPMIQFHDTSYGFSWFTKNQTRRNNGKIITEVWHMEGERDDHPDHLLPALWKASFNWVAFSSATAAFWWSLSTTLGWMCASVCQRAGATVEPW